MRFCLIIDRGDGISYAAIADDVALRIGDSDLDTTIHPTSFVQDVVGDGPLLSVRFDGYLVLASAVLHQEIADTLCALTA